MPAYVVRVHTGVEYGVEYGEDQFTSEVRLIMRIVWVVLGNSGNSGGFGGQDSWRDEQWRAVILYASSGILR